MVKNLVSKFVKEAPPYNFGVGEKKKPFKKGITEAIELHKNENPFGISPLAEKVMKEQCSLSNRYPDIRATELREKLAKLHHVTPENIIVTQGATSSLAFIGDMLICEGDEVIVTSPTYPNYYNIIKKNNGTLVDVPMDEDYTPDFDKIAAAITAKTKAIFLCNPNNPTGTICDDKALITFASQLPQHVVLIVDEAYFEFIDKTPYQSMIDHISEDRNIIVTKTFSKIYGMAGCRIGYAVANKEIINYLQIDATGFCCNRIGLAGALAAIDDKEFVQMTIEKNLVGRTYLTNEMQTLGYQVWPSHSNFIFFDAHIDPKYMANELYSYGVNIRGDFTKCRISIGTMEQNKQAIQAMQEITTQYNQQNTENCHIK